MSYPSIDRCNLSLNNQRDGFGKTLIHPGQFNYYPNREQVDSATPANVAAAVSSRQVDPERTYDGNAAYNEKESAAVMPVRSFTRESSGRS